MISRQFLVKLVTNDFSLKSEMIERNDTRNLREHYKSIKLQFGEIRGMSLDQFETLGKHSILQLKKFDKFVTFFMKLSTIIWSMLKFVLWMNQ
jgi:hypothetical protein